MNDVAFNTELFRNYEQVTTRFDKCYEALWTFMTQENRVPNANPELMEDLYNHHNEITKTGGYVESDNERTKIRYAILASSKPDYFQMGGDLALMANAVRNKDRESLTKYANFSLEVIAQRLFSFNLPNILTISLVQGKTLGAGIEAALTSDIVIAERHSTFSFPEILFNMFPGMGAHSILSRKIGMQATNKMIVEATEFTAQQFYDMGLIDILVETGQGEQEVYKFIERHKNKSAGLLSIHKAKKIVNAITREELFSIVDLWVDNALSLSERDLKLMGMFIRSQQKLFNLNLAAPIPIRPHAHQQNDTEKEVVYGTAH